MDAPGRESPSEVESSISENAPVNPCPWTDEEDTGDEGTGEEETFRDEDLTVPPDLERLDNLEEYVSLASLEDNNNGDLVARDGDGGKKSYAETARMFKLRRNLDQLDCFHRQTERDVLKAREELKVCGQNITDFEKRRAKLEEKMEREKEADNSAAVLRLRAQHKCLCQELQQEEEVAAYISSILKERERELCRFEVEQGRLAQLRQEVQEEERAYQALKEQRAAARLQQEHNATQNLLLKAQRIKGKQVAMHKKEEAQRQRNTEQALANHSKAAKYLKETLKRMHEQEAVKEQQSTELLQRRVQAVKSLKANIAAAQESLRVQQSRAKVNAQKKEQEKKQLRESLQAQGIDSIKHMYQHKQLEEFKRRKLELEERQRANRKDIVAKILQEEQSAQRLMRQSQQLPPTERAPVMGRARRRVLRYLDPKPPPTKEEVKGERVFSDESSSSEHSDQEDLKEARGDQEEEEEEQGLMESLAEPEFSGLWHQTHKSQRSMVEEGPAKLLQERAEKQDVSLIPDGTLPVPARKVVCGKELKGPPFISKPELILFKDFEVGRTYKKRVILTNISYTTNYSKLLRVSTHLMDFVSVSFDSPGSISAGMACDMLVVFQPKINQDLEGEVQFVSATGPFSVPIRCTIKKCDLVVDRHLIDFGTHVVGQTISRTITLTNRGALGTRFSLDTSTCPTPANSQVQMLSQASSTSTQQVTSSQISPPDNQESPEEVQSKPDSQGLLMTSQPQQSEVSVSCPEAAAGVNPADVPEQGEALTDQASDVPEQEEALTDQASEASDITLGQVREGEIGPFHSVKLEAVFTPTIPGEAKLDFHITFSDPASEPIPIKVRGEAISVPVWVAQPNIDLKICMFDRLYQDSIMVQSRANTALRLTFDVCPELQHHMEVLPKTGFIQARSTFSAQLKFLPRRSLSEDARKFFDIDTGVLEAPLTVQVADQVQPVPFTVHAVVTSSDLQFDGTKVDFGYCSIYESVKANVRLTNLSLLPQEYGFMDIPEFIEVQPNDGFGTLLAQETVAIDLIFSAKKAKEYHFQLNCKSGINRDFLISCRAVGVHPPLELSHSLVQFGATALGDHSTATLYVINSHTSRNEFSHPVPRVGREAVAPIGPRLFSFAVPQDSQISIAPSAGRLLPGERCLVQVTFRPRLLECQIRDEAARLAFHNQRCSQQRESVLEISKHADVETTKEVSVEPNKGKKVPRPPPQGKRAPNRKNSKVSISPKTEDPVKPISPADIQPGSEEYAQGKASLLYDFPGLCQCYRIPCYVSDGDPLLDDPRAEPTWSPLNTLHLELHCPAVRPPLLVTTTNGETTIDFNQVAVGQKVVKKIAIQNISREPLDLRSSVLDLSGPFCLLNALRAIAPGCTQTLLLAFTPTLGKKYRETLEVLCQKMTVELTLRGEGVEPVVSCSPEGDLLSFSYVLEEETTSQLLKLQNSSSLAVGFRVLLDSVDLPKPDSSLPLLLSSHPERHTQPSVGSQNHSGLSVFSVTPVNGSIAPGQSQDITVAFQPDHQSAHYADRLTVELSNKTIVCVKHLKGAACSHTMYLSGGDALTVPTESLLPLPEPTHPEHTVVESQRCDGVPVLLTLVYNKWAKGPATREVEVGCIRTTQPVKKNGEFHWDNLAVLQQRGFSVEPSKGTVEAGQRCTITVTWTPPSGHKPYEVVQVCAPLTLKGDETEVYNVTLLALSRGVTTFSQTS